MRVQKVSLETIAKLAGVHKATVSRSLRNHPTIPLETRQRIQAIAKDLGYRPNPLVSMFQSQARSSRPERLKAALGWLSDYPQEDCWREFPWLKGYLEGAQARCEEMGYRLELLQVRPEGRSFQEEQRRIADYMLRHGIYGLVLPLVLDVRQLLWKWENCVVALIGGGHRFPDPGGTSLPARFYPQNFPSADRDHFYNARLAVRCLRERGYHRVGLVYSKYLDDEANGAARAGFLVEQQEIPAEDRVPILILERFKEGRPAEFDQWFFQYRPDALLCVNPIVKAWMEGLGLAVPEQVGIANLNLVEDIGEWSGVWENHPAVGAAAVDLLLSALSRNQIGLPPTPRKLLVPGQWRDGTTLKPKA